MQSLLAGLAKITVVFQYTSVTQASAALVTVVLKKKKKKNFKKSIKKKKEFLKELYSRNTLNKMSGPIMGSSETSCV